MENYKQGKKHKSNNWPFATAILAPFLTIFIGSTFQVLVEPYLIVLALFSLYWIYGKKSYKEKRISGIVLGGLSLALISNPMIIAALGFATVGFAHDVKRSREEIFNRTKEVK